jgi:predicted ATPase
MPKLPTPALTPADLPVFVGQLELSAPVADFEVPARPASAGGGQGYRRARLLIRLGRAEEARDSAMQARALIEESGESSIEADVHLAAGESWEAAGSAHLEQAQACYEKALETARKQQAKAWELRAAIALARLWRRQGRREKIRDLIAPVYGWFTEGHDTADLREAAALLSELR